MGNRHLFVLTDELLEAVGSIEDVDKIFLEMKAFDLAHLPYPEISITFNFKNMCLAVGMDEVSFNNLRDADAEMYRRRASGGEDLKVRSHFDSLRWTLDITSGSGDVTLTIEWPDGMVGWKSFAHAQVADALARLKRLSIYDAVTRNRGGQSEEVTNLVAFFTLGAVRTLIVSLATRNTLKRTTENKRAERGHGKAIFRRPGGDVDTVYISRTVLEPPAITAEHQGGTKIPHLRRGHQHTFLIGAGRTGRLVKWVSPMFVAADRAHLPPKPRTYVLH